MQTKSVHIVYWSRLVAVTILLLLVFTVVTISDPRRAGTRLSLRTFRSGQPPIKHPSIDADENIHHQFYSNKRVWKEGITPFPASFWYIKSYKTGSSTMAGIFRQICAHYGIACLKSRLARFQSAEEIQNAALRAKSVGFEHVAVANHVQFMPGAARSLGEGHFLFTTVRHPISRVLSHYFYRLISDPTKAKKKQYTVAEGVECVKKLENNQTCALLNGFEKHVVVETGNTLFNYIKGNKKSSKEAFDQYNFVFITERWDESLVAFMLLYGLQFEDVGYLKSKDRSLVYPHASIMPQDKLDFIIKKNPRDIELFDLANESLNQKIENLKTTGIAFDEILRQFKELNALVQAECSHYRQWYSQHNFDTVYSYFRDNGIGTRCIRAVMRGAGY